ncbi:hypothetical protein [Gordonia rhizosphera]|uniref:Secreted protein n=1 Tax=Gordonia rhizosphera NBRC 16068 TaxID=1108045 RepID=K6V4Q5_9ACTN|nr:hypothetical protein [Gordonia rhizosphera]GAB91153.1 hypothetical protein GORHZ_125_00360 [Gordonia rhizosphera NBRC 16068]
MTIVYFVIAALALAGAVALLWLDRQRSNVARHQRAIWGDQHEFKFRESDTKLRKVFRRATMNVPDHIQVRDVAFGHYGGAEAAVFDLAETATVIAVRRANPSSVIVDLRHEDVLAPAEEDVELLGAMGPRVMFSNNLDVARRVCDRRMVALANTAPPFIEVLWNEGEWVLGSMPLTTDNERLDTGLQVVRRFADLLRVLPPVVDPQEAPDPRDPHGPIRAEYADEKTESMRDKQRRARMAAAESTGPDTGTAPESGAEAPAPTRAWSAANDSTSPASSTASRRMKPMPVRGPARPPTGSWRTTDPDAEAPNPPANPERAARPYDMPPRSSSPTDRPNRHRRN